MAVISSLNLLPIEYQPVEYIESTGLEYINTGLVPNQNYGFDVFHFSLSFWLFLVK